MWAKMDMAKTDIALGNYAAADKTVDILIADFSDQPELPTAIFILGEQYYNKAFLKERQGDSEQGKEYYRKTLCVWERIITELPPSAMTAQAYYSMAGCYESLGEYEKAIEYCETVANTWPNFNAWRVQFMIARCYEDLEKSGRIGATHAAAEIRQVCEKLADDPDPQATKAARGLLNRWGLNTN